MYVKALAAEFVGTFALCFVGILAIANSGDSLVVSALAHGLTIAVFAYATMDISGGQFNPAVTVGLLAVGKMKPKAAMGYVITQCLAGVGAALVVLPLVESIGVVQGTPVVDGDKVGIGGALAMEVMLTFLLVFVICGAAAYSKTPKLGALFIGLTVSMAIFAGGPFTGAAMNPARHLGPALVSGNGKLIGQVWLYWLAPVTGGVLACLAYHAIHTPDARVESEA
jgi:aquaporin Z